MRRAVVTTVIALTSLSFVHAGSEGVQLVGRDASTTCEEIAAAVSSASAVYYPLSLQYTADNFHWASSSSQSSSCTVEPGTVEDVGAILQVLGSTQTPFGVKGGGHTANPGFSSTPGVEISMARFDGVSYDSSTGLASIGPGLIWDDVYAALEPYGVNVVGGRVTGVGMAGFTLGGGFSYTTNQYGLTIDTVSGYELVLPNGTATTVTASTYPDLFFALKGGFNNYGIVTSFILETHTQGEVWGGTILVVGAPSDVVVATQHFYENVTDPKASIITTFNNALDIPATEVILFYDGPTPPAGIFEEFLEIPALYQDISTRSYLSLVTSAPSNITQSTRGFFNTVSLYNLTVPMLNAIVNETEYWASALALEVPGIFVSYDVEPFLPSYLTHGSASAWPPSRDVGPLPLNIYYAWDLPESDALVNQVMIESAEYLTQLAISEGQPIADLPLYPNYAIYNTTLERLYANNLPTLQETKTKYDPNNVMGLAGGWRF